MYTSFEEEVAKDCILCGQNTDDTIQFGRKITINDLTVHHYCLVTLFCYCIVFHSSSYTKYFCLFVAAEREFK